MVVFRRSFAQTDRFRRVVNDAVYYQLLLAVDAAENGSFESGSAHLRIHGALLSETIRPMKLADLSGTAEQLVRGFDTRGSKFPPTNASGRCLPRSFWFLARDDASPPTAERLALASELPRRLHCRHHRGSSAL